MTVNVKKLVILARLAHFYSRPCTPAWLFKSPPPCSRFSRAVLYEMEALGPINDQKEETNVALAASTGKYLEPDAQNVPLFCAAQFVSISGGRYYTALHRGSVARCRLLRRCWLCVVNNLCDNSQKQYRSEVKEGC